jgi:hypothetical protein
MLKHILTAKCNRSCGYCISRNVHQEEQHGVRGVVDRYMEFHKKGHREIMLTGGEPTMAKFFLMYVSFARQIFDRVFITTQNPEMLSNDNLWLNGKTFDAITFSIHDAIVPEVTNGATVYASILDARYKAGLAEELKAKGYSGLTINEEHRGTAIFNEPLPEIEGFSIRINRRGKCLDEPMILPDLTTIDNFKEYL